VVLRGYAARCSLVAFALFGCGARSDLESSRTRQAAPDGGPAPTGKPDARVLRLPALIAPLGTSMLLGRSRGVGPRGESARGSLDGLDRSQFREQDFVMSSAAVKRVIDLASELSEDERRVVVDAIAPKESVASLADEWSAEIERRTNLVRSGRSEGKPAEEVFDRLESKLKAR